MARKSATQKEFNKLLLAIMKLTHGPEGEVSLTKIGIMLTGICYGLMNIPEVAAVNGLVVALKVVLVFGGIITGDGLRDAMTKNRSAEQ